MRRDLGWIRIVPPPLFCPGLFSGCPTQNTTPAFVFEAERPPTVHYVVHPVVTLRTPPAGFVGQLTAPQSAETLQFLQITDSINYK